MAFDPNVFSPLSLSLKDLVYTVVWMEMLLDMALYNLIDNNKLILTYI